jgi:hypothetical protein
MFMNRSSRGIGVLLATLLGLGLLSTGARPAAASMVLAMDLQALTRDADRVVVGEVTKVSSAWDKKHERILTTVEVRVAEMWKGEMPSDGRVTIVQPGGVADGIEMRVHGMPAFVPGERAVLFLRGAAAQTAAVVGMGQGKRGVAFDPARKRWMVDGGDRSAAVNVDLQGRTHAAAPEVPLPLEELRKRVTTMVKAR